MNTLKQIKRESLSYNKQKKRRYKEANRNFRTENSIEQLRCQLSLNQYTGLMHMLSKSQ